MKRPQWITLILGLALIAVLYFFGKTVPRRKAPPVAIADSSEHAISTDSILAQARSRLSPALTARLTYLENSLKADTGSDPRKQFYHQMAHFWGDTAQLFEPFAWYEAQAARLENSEKSLTFAAHLFLRNLRGESDFQVRTWKATQAKDLFERSLKINPENDSSLIGLGACEVFGSLSASPMEAIQTIRKVADRDTTNIFAQEMLGHAAMISGQYDRAINRFQTVYRLSVSKADARLEASLMLAEAFERKGDKPSSIGWYKNTLELTGNDEIKTEIKKRIEELSAPTN